MVTEEQKPPPGWGNDNLSNYLKTTYENAFYFTAAHRGRYELLSDITDIFEEISGIFKQLSEEKLIASAFFFSMARSSLLSSIRLATGGQLPDSYKCLRGCLESSAYGFHINANEDGYDKFEIFIKRMDDEDAKKNAREEFSWGNVKNTLKGKEPKLGQYLEKLYDQTIDYGAHPNAAALLADLKVPDEESNLYEIHYVSKIKENPIPFIVCIKFIAEIGILALMIYEVIFKTRYELMGATDKLEKIRASYMTAFKQDPIPRRLVIDWSQITGR